MRAPYGVYGDKYIDLHLVSLYPLQTQYTADLATKESALAAAHTKTDAERQVW